MDLFGAFWDRFGTFLMLRFPPRIVAVTFWHDFGSILGPFWSTVFCPITLGVIGQKSVDQIGSILGPFRDYSDAMDPTSDCAFTILFSCIAQHSHVSICIPPVLIWRGRSIVAHLYVLVPCAFFWVALFRLCSFATLPLQDFCWSCMEDHCIE